MFGPWGGCWLFPGQEGFLVPRGAAAWSLGKVPRTITQLLRSRLKGFLPGVAGRELKLAVDGGALWRVFGFFFATLEFKYCNILCTSNGDRVGVRLLLNIFLVHRFPSFSEAEQQELGKVIARRHLERELADNPASIDSRWLGKVLQTAMYTGEPLRVKDIARAFKTTNHRIGLEADSYFKASGFYMSPPPLERYAYCYESGASSFRSSPPAKLRNLISARAEARGMGATTQAIEGYWRLHGKLAEESARFGEELLFGARDGSLVWPEGEAFSFAPPRGGFQQGSTIVFSKSERCAMLLRANEEYPGEWDQDFRTSDAAAVGGLAAVFLENGHAFEAFAEGVRSIEGVLGRSGFRFFLWPGLDRLLRGAGAVSNSLLNPGFGFAPVFRSPSAADILDGVASRLFLVPRVQGYQSLHPLCRAWLASCSSIKDELVVMSDQYGGSFSVVLCRFFFVCFKCSFNACPHLVIPYSVK